MSSRRSWVPSWRPRRSSSIGRARAAARTCSFTAYPVRVNAFPATRLRRLRRTPALRDLVRETTLSLDDLVMPLFVAPEPRANDRLPALSRHTVDGVVRECEELLRSGIKAVILFGIPEEKDDEGSGAWIAGRDRPARPTGAAGPVPRAAVAHRRLSLRIHVARTLRSASRRGGRQRRIARADRAHRRLACGGRRRCRLPERHDGRPRRRDPGRACRDPDHRVRGEVRLLVLRSVPRGGRVSSRVR